MTPPRLGLLYRCASELLETILSGDRPADRQMDLYFRSHRTLGQRDRGFIADTVYGCLRRKRSLEYRLGGVGDPGLVVAAYLLTETGMSARSLERLDILADASTLCETVRTARLADAPLAVQANLPDWAMDRLTDVIGVDEIMGLANALNSPAPLDVRINSLRATREEGARRLADEGFDMRPTSFSPTALRSQTHLPIFHSRPFKEGWLEVQDEASQLVALCLDPRRHECVVDFCAGGGGKTLHIGALMHNTGMLYALDTVPKRLERAKLRIRRAGLHNVRIQTIENEHDPRLARLSGKADRVLVDAPCSGSGTWRRNPDIKWRIGPDTLARLVRTQRQILDAASSLVKPSGRLVYATCSLLSEENETLVTGFLSAHPDYRIEPVQAVLDRKQIPLVAGAPFLQLFPHRHGTDGFFVAVLARSS